MSDERERPSGRLVLVATPIGNLGDLSPRAVEELAAADVIACEDTRHSGRLLARFGIATPTFAVHDHNEAARASEIADRVAGGAVVALICDAGTPGVSDPGHEVVRAVAQRGLPVGAVPGPSAVVQALVLSGLPTDRFAFEGFLPRKAGPRRQRLAAVAGDERTLVFYVAPHRAADDLAAMAEAFGADRPAAVARELTKLHEEVSRAPLGELAAAAAADPPKGELTVVVGPASPVDPGGALTEDDVLARLRELEDRGLSRRDAVRQVADETGWPKRRVYDLATD